MKQKKLNADLYPEEEDDEAELLSGPMKRAAKMSKTLKSES